MLQIHTQARVGASQARGRLEREPVIGGGPPGSNRLRGNIVRLSIARAADLLIAPTDSVLRPDRPLRKPNVCLDQRIESDPRDVLNRHGQALGDDAIETAGKPRFNHRSLALGQAVEQLGDDADGARLLTAGTGPDVPLLQGLHYGATDARWRSERDADPLAGSGDVAPGGDRDILGRG